MNKFWMVYVEGKSSPTKKHETLEDAEREAVRLAQQNDGRSVFLLIATAHCRTVRPNVEWRPVPDNDLYIRLGC